MQTPQNTSDEWLKAGRLFAASCLLVFVSSLSFAQTAVEIEINQTPETTDDYITWSPTWCRIRATGAVTAAVPVMLSNEAVATDGGRILFAHAEPWIPGQNATEETITLTLPQNGDWVDFVIAGRFGSPSINDKDTEIVATAPAPSGELGRQALMVRVRKNANDLTPGERDRFLAAIKAMNDSGVYEQFSRTHFLALLEAHFGPGFVAWHRAYILAYERSLQAIDPSVSLHYWRFDDASPNLFHPDFLGGTPPAGNDGTPEFSETNPLRVWNVNNPDFSPATEIYRGNEGAWVDHGGLPSTAVGTEPGEVNTAYPDIAAYFGKTLCDLNEDPNTTGSAFRTEDEVIESSDYLTFSSALEANPHGVAHDWSGFITGWMTNLRTAAQDPLFFMLHSNVDRLWALWQWKYDRFGTTEADYSLQGTYATRSEDDTYHIGHYLDDTMWPWNGETGTLDPFPVPPRNICIDGVFQSNPETQQIYAENRGIRPNEITEIPIHPRANLGPATSAPRPRDMIDYLGRLDPSLGLGFSYDDISYEVAPSTSGVDNWWMILE